MNIYTPGEYAYLRYDLEHVLNQIGELYEVRGGSAGLMCESIMRAPDGAFWASTSTTEHFNTLIPKFKSMHMAMYALLEAVAKQELNQKSVAIAFEQMDPLITPFRHLNNQFKHFGKKGVEIDLISVAYIAGKSDTRIEPMYRVDGKLIRYQEFVIMFFNLLKRAGVITI